MITRIFALRHVERDKSNTEDLQVPTPGGEISAYAMGMEIRRRYAPNFLRCVSSPQPRAIRTARILLAGVNGYNPVTMQPPIQTDPRLNDFSSDLRPEVKEGLAIGKEHACRNALEVEEAMFLAKGAQGALGLKVDELLEVIETLAFVDGDVLLAGLHGAAIDGACLELRFQLDPAITFSLGSNGGMFNKVEGFVATFQDGTLTSVELIRQPDYLKTLATVLR